MDSVKRYTILMIMLGLGMIIAALRLPGAQACQICVPYPEETLADRLLANDEIIFARERAGAPYVFYPVEAIRGPLGTEDFKLFCDSGTRRKLGAITDSVVVLARMSGNDNWQLFTFADIDLQHFIRVLVSQSAGWPDAPVNEDRLHFFSGYLTSDHPRIQKQAYLEIGRAPYSLIKQFAKEISRTQIYDMLGNYRLVEWHNLYILMLGQSRDGDDLEFIKNKVESAARIGSTLNLAAWTTAFIESHSEDGIEAVKRMYFAHPGRTKEEIEQVMASMSVLGSQTTSFDLKIFKLRTKIVQCYEVLLENYPEMAGNIAKDLAAWRVQAYVDRISAIRRDTEILDSASIHIVDYYLSMAPTFKKVSPTK